MQRGEIWWASLPAPTGAGPGSRRPVVIIQSNEFNRSAIRTIVAAAITSNTRLAAAPGNVELRKRTSKLARHSVVNVSQVLTVDRSLLQEQVSRLPADVMSRVDDGLRLVMAL